MIRYVLGAQLPKRSIEFHQVFEIVPSAGMFIQKGINSVPVGLRERIRCPGENVDEVFQNAVFSLTCRDVFPCR